MADGQPFPVASQTIAPGPSSFWGSCVCKPPYPTNSAWLNYVLNSGDQPEYIHPFLVQSSSGAISICYPSRVVQAAYIIQAFQKDFTLSSRECGGVTHAVSHYDDLSLTLELGDGVTVPLVRGSPYITCVFRHSTPCFSTIHAVLDVWASQDGAKHKVTLNNGQVWVIYSSKGLSLSRDLTCREPFTGVVRISVLTSRDAEEILDRYHSCYAVRGRADFPACFTLHYHWETEGWGDLLMLSLPVHRQILAKPSGKSRIGVELFNSIDGPLQGVVGDMWVLKEKEVQASWYASKWVSSAERAEIAAALESDANALSAIQNPSTYFHGKALARAARLALIASEVSCQHVLTKVQQFLKEAVTPWLVGEFQGNAVLYDLRWGGLISREGAKDAGADFGLGLYNDHHYHWGYFVYAGAVLAKLDPAWGQMFKGHLYSFVRDYMNLDSKDHLFPRLRNFDLWVLHSWAGGLVEFADGRNQESTSEAVHAYYAAALLGMSFSDDNLINPALTLAALEARGARSLWHIPSSCTIYEPGFVEANKMVGVLWANKRDTGLWFASPESRECRVGIQLLPLCPYTQNLFPDADFVRELVEWTLPRLTRTDVTDGWRGFVYALMAIYDKQQALDRVRALQSHDDGNSLSNLLWWIFSR